MVMYFPLIITLSIQFLFHHQQASSSQIVKFSEKSLNNILKRYFIDLKKSYLQNYEPRHVTIVGAFAEDFQQTEPFFGNYPYVICKEAKICGYTQEFSQGSLVIVFLEDLSEKSFRKNVQVLSRSNKSKVFFIFNGTLRIENVLSILTLALKHNLVNSELAHLQPNSIKIYSDFLSTNCSIDVRIVNVWKPASSSSNRIKISLSRLRNMNGCPVSVSSLTFTPQMMIESTKNGSLRITGGREGNLIIALAEQLNFTIALRHPSFEDQLKYSRKGAILNDVSSGTSKIGIGRLRPTKDFHQTLAASIAYDEECVTWGIPRLIIWSNDIMLVEFSWQVWLSVSLVFTICCTIGYVYQNVIVTSKYGAREKLRFVTILLDVVAMHLGNPVLHVSSSAGGRFMLILCLYYAMVMTTAYKTSLASILATNEGTPRIVDAQGIIDENLNVNGTLYDYNILKDQANGSNVTAELLKRMTINNNNSFSWEQLMSDRNFAFLARRSSFDYDRKMILSNKKAVTYDILDGCVLAYGTVMVFQKISVLRKPVDKIIARLAESGILTHWGGDKFNADKISKRKTAGRYIDDHAAYNKFRNIFIFYFLCIAVSVFAFFLELITSKLKNHKSKQRMNQTSNI